VARVRHIIIPELLPHLVAAARAGLSVIWKIVLVVEFLGRGTGIGRQIHTQFSIFNVTGVLAYALSFVVFILLIEFFIMQPLERYAARWRQNA
jgi:NitT/TauT family transport system permease protein